MARPAKSDAPLLIPKVVKNTSKSFKSRCFHPHGVATIEKCPRDRKYWDEQREFCTATLLPSGKCLFICSMDDIISTKCLGKKDCLYANPDECNGYIQCTVDPGEITGTTVYIDCSDGEEWNNNEKECGSPRDSTCPTKLHPPK